MKGTRFLFKISRREVFFNLTTKEVKQVYEIQDSKRDIVIVIAASVHVGYEHCAKSLRRDT